MIRLAALIFLAATGAVSAAGIDEVYEKPSDQGFWGSILQAAGIGEFQRSYAIVIGISDFSGYNDLPTQNDPIRMRDYLINEANFDYVHTLTDEKVTKTRIAELMLDEFPERVTSNDRFLFYWSGHGVTRPAARGEFGYLPLGDSEKGRYSSMVAMADIARWDQFISASQVLYLLDSCFAGLAGVAAKSDTQDLNLQQLMGPSRHIMTAGTSGEETIAIDALGGSVFTAAVIDGLKGAADAANAFGTDELVSVGELKEYVATRVEFERQKIGWKKPMTPQLRDLDVNQGAFFFAVPDGKFGIHKAGVIIEDDLLANGVATKGDVAAKSDVQTAGIGPDPDLAFAQDALIDLGFDIANASGLLDYQTRRALLSFQNAQGIELSGIYDDATRESLLLALATPPAANDPLADTGETLLVMGEDKPLKECDDCPVMIPIYPGRFTYGVDDPDLPTEGPAQRVDMRPFYMSQTEITRADFSEFLYENESRFDDGNDCYEWVAGGKMKRTLDPYTYLDRLVQDMPVSCVSRLDALAYVEWLNGEVGEPVYSLPDETQIEYVLKGGARDEAPVVTCGAVNLADGSSFFPWADSDCDDGHGGIARAGSFPANFLGVQDLYGNLWEWAADCWTDSHENLAVSYIFDDAGTSCSKSGATVRGASFDDSLDKFRPTVRQPVPEDRRQINIGFRVVRQPFVSEAEE